MKTAITIKILMVALLASFFLSCASRSQRVGSADDTTGTNGATNGTGKVPQSETVHNYKN